MPGQVVRELCKLTMCDEALPIHQEPRCAPVIQREASYLSLRQRIIVIGQWLAGQCHASAKVSLAIVRLHPCLVRHMPYATFATYSPMLFSRSKQVKPRSFSYTPRHSKGPVEERAIRFRDTPGVFLSRNTELGHGMRRNHFAKRNPNRVINKFTKYLLILALMAVVYVMYSDQFIVSETFGGELAKVLAGFALLFFLLFVFIKKSNTAI